MPRATTAKKPKTHFQPVKMGLGEAIQRLVQVEWRFRTGTGAVPEDLLGERVMLLEALNTIPVDVGFDCNGDGVPDTVEIFEQAVSTSCCRLMPPGAKPPAKKRRSTSRKKTVKKTKKAS